MNARLYVSVSEGECLEASEEASYRIGHVSGKASWKDTRGCWRPTGEHVLKVSRMPIQEIEDPGSVRHQYRTPACVVLSFSCLLPGQRVAIYPAAPCTVILHQTTLTVKLRVSECKSM